jgi:hypothetical protein
MLGTAADDGMADPGDLSFLRRDGIRNPANHRHKLLETRRQGNGDTPEDYSSPTVRINIFTWNK